MAYLGSTRINIAAPGSQSLVAAGNPLPTKVSDGTDTLSISSDGAALSDSRLLAYRSSDSTYQPLRIDSATNSLQTVDYAHHEVHAGSSFYYHDVIALNSGAVQNYLIITPNTTKWAHFGYEIDGNDGAFTTEIFEGSDRTGTTQQTVLNRNRNSATAATVTVFKGYTSGTTDGTRIIWKRLGTGKTSGGSSGSAEERVLKQNTQYTLRVTNNAGATNNVTVVLRWYEHTNII